MVVKQRILFTLLLIPLVSFCQQTKSSKSLYPDSVGDIAFNKATDNENFELCYEKHIFQYFNNSGGLDYDGDKLAIEKEFAQKFKSVLLENENGLIRIRFVVNCKGATDRFRLIAMDDEYHEKIFPQTITNQLIDITRTLKGWKIKKYGDQAIDYYQYLIFKIENGQLKEILP